MLRHTFSIGISPSNTVKGIKAESFVMNIAGHGCVFVLMAISSRDNFDAIITNTIQEQLTRFAERGLNDPSLLEAQFEHLIHVISERLSGELDDNLLDQKRNSMALGVVFDNSLILTGFGFLGATFLRQEKTNTYHVFDLLRSLREAGEETNNKTNNIFDALITGDLQEGDIIGLATAETIKEIGEEQWKRMLATLTPAEVGSAVRHNLGSKKTAGIALILKFETPALNTSKDEQTRLPLKSIENLRETERNTERFLAKNNGLGVFPFITRIAKKFFIIIKDAFLKIFYWTKTKLQQDRLSTHSIKKIEKTEQCCAPATPRDLTKNILNRLRETTSNLSVHIKNIFKPNSNQKTARATFSAIIISSFNKLPRVSKFLLTIVLVFLAISIQSIIYLNYRNRIQLEQTTYNNAVNEIKQLKNEAEASLIYNDEEKARVLLLNAIQKINILPQNSRGLRKTAEGLKQEIQTSLNDLRHEIVIDLTALEIAITPPDKNSFDFNLTLYGSANEQNAVVSVTTYDDKIIRLRGDGALESIDNGGAINQLTVSLPNSSTPTDVAIFGSRLYALVSQVPQIYRLTRTKNGYSGSAAWIADDATKIADARTITIDGAVYILRPREVLKYFSGLPENWTPYIDPPLEDASKIWTSDEANGIYILERATRRVIVLSKPGNLLAQYIFPEGANIRDFAVDEKGKKISILDGEQIKQTNLSHLTQ